MHHKIIALLALVTLSLSQLTAAETCCPSKKADSTKSAATCSEEDKAAAVAAATQWLALCDQGDYAKSWQEAASLFKTAVKEEQWQQALTSTRTPLGALVKRSIKSKECHSSLPGAPDGQYVLIQFEASFENKETAIETVTPMLEKDGTWRVSGYYIK